MRDKLDRKRKIYLPWKEDSSATGWADIRTAAGIDPAAKFMGLRHARLSQHKSIIRSFGKYHDPPREGRMAIHIAWRDTLGGLAVTAAATDVHRRADSTKAVV